MRTLLAFVLMATVSSFALGQQSPSDGAKAMSASWPAGSPVNSLAVSGDGNRIVAAVTPSTLKMWDSKGNELLTIRVADLLNVAAISADGKWLAGGSATGRLWVWHADGKEVFEVKAHANSVRSLAFSPDGKRLASGSQDKTAKIWDVPSGKNLLELSHPHFVLSVAFSPNGNLLATGGQNNAARIWNLQTGKESLVLPNLNSEVACVVFSPDGERFVTGCWKLIKVWETATGKSLASIKGEPGRSQGIAFSPDGKFLAAGGDENSVGVWDSRSGKLMFQLPGHTGPVRALAFSRDGKSLVTGGQDEFVRVWDVSRPADLIARLQPKEKQSDVLNITSEITDKSPKVGFSGNHAVVIPVTFSEGKTYQMDMSGISLGVLWLEDPSGKHVASDGGSAGFDRPRIIHQAKTSGRYLITCTSQHSRPETGRFTLIVKETTSDPKELARPIELRLVNGRAAVDAELEPRGPRYKNNPCKFLTVALEQGVTYRVQMSSREFLSHVFVEDPDGQLIGDDFIRPGKARPASVTFTAPKSGPHRLIASQHDIRSGGPQFHLTVEIVKSP